MADLPTETSAPVERPPHHDLRRDRDRAVRAMVVGAIIAILAPLLGFLGGSMIGSTDDPGDIDPMIVWLFAGLVVGGVGALIGFLGILRWMRVDRHAGAAE